MDPGINQTQILEPISQFFIIKETPTNRLKVRFTYRSKQAKLGTNFVQHFLTYTRVTPN
jgi:hypothetical protein